MSATARTLILSTAVLLAGACTAPEAGKPDAKTDAKVAPSTAVKAPPVEAKKVTPPPPTPVAQPTTPPP